MVTSKILSRLDLSDDFLNQFDVQNKALKKQVGLYGVESIDNPDILTISVNPKEYFEKYRDKRINKKHKGLKKDTPGMDFEAYSSRLLSLYEFCHDNIPEKIKQKRFQIVHNSMQIISVSKTQFAGLNDKRFYFHDGIVLLPFGHFLLEASRKLKQQYKSRIKTAIKEQKYKFLAAEADAVKKCERVWILRNIFSLPPLYYLLNSANLVRGRMQRYKSTRQYIVNCNWKK